MSNRDVLILLCSRLSVGVKHKPFSSREIEKIIFLLKQNNFELKDLSKANKSELKKIFFADKILEKQEEGFINRIELLLSRRGSIAFDIMEIGKWGIKLLTIFDEEYPKRLLEYLPGTAPTIFYYVGNLELLNKKLFGFVGSRLKRTNIDSETVTKTWAGLAIDNGYGIISGGASGVDTFSTQEAIRRKADFVEVLSDSLIERLKITQISKAIQENRALLLSEVIPNTKFNVANAMMRNKYIYLLANRVIAITAKYQIKNGQKSGGAWNGAIENFNSDYTNLFVINDPNEIGNQELIEMGIPSLCFPPSQESIKNAFYSTYPIEKIANNRELDRKLLLILNQPGTLLQVKFTEKQLETLRVIPNIDNVTFQSFQEIESLFGKPITKKIKDYCISKLETKKQNETYTQLTMF